MNCHEAEPRILILGIGNTLRGDDGVGPVAVERLRGVLNDEGVSVSSCQQLLPELAEAMSRARLAVFIDACCDLRPGEVACERVDVSAATGETTTHHFDPAALVALAMRLYGRCAEAYVVAVGAECFGYSESLSPRVAAAVDTVVERVRGLLRGEATAGRGALCQEPTDA